MAFPFRDGRRCHWEKTIEKLLVVQGAVTGDRWRVVGGVFEGHHTTFQWVGASTYLRR